MLVWKIFKPKVAFAGTARLKAVGALFELLQLILNVLSIIASHTMDKEESVPTDVTFGKVLFTLITFEAILIPVPAEIGDCRLGLFCIIDQSIVVGISTNRATL